MTIEPMPDARLELGAVPPARLEAGEVWRAGGHLDVNPETRPHRAVLHWSDRAGGTHAETYELQGPTG
jgi:hypothetical protein